MNRTDARRIAETIKNHELLQMFTNAKAQIKDWEVKSIVNKGCSKGAAWNILAAKFDVHINHHILAKTNMVREFGEFLPGHLLLPKEHKKAKQEIEPMHQEPNFKNYED